MLINVIALKHKLADNLKTVPYPTEDFVFSRQTFYVHLITHISACLVEITNRGFLEGKKTVIYLKDFLSPRFSDNKFLWRTTFAGFHMNTHSSPEKKHSRVIKTFHPPTLIIIANLWVFHSEFMQLCFDITSVSSLIYQIQWKWMKRLPFTGMEMLVPPSSVWLNNIITQTAHHIWLFIQLFTPPHATVNNNFSRQVLKSLSISLIG